MKVKINLILFLLAAVNLSCSKTLSEINEAEILGLKTEKEIDLYWVRLHQMDQAVLLETENIIKYDSTSMDHMIRTALIFEIHGSKSYTPNNFVPILNFTHSNIGKANLAFWPIIQECVKVGGTIEHAGGGYPAYQLEGIANTFYDYSLINQEAIYPRLLDQLKKYENKDVIQNLELVIENQKELQNLTELKTLNKWHEQSFKNKMGKRYFEFVKMSDNAIYLKKYDRIQKLLLTKTENNYKTYRIEDEPFGWYYIYKNNGDLSLYNDKNESLINYTLYN